MNVSDTKKLNITFKKKFKKELSIGSFNTWINPIKIILIDKDNLEITLQTPSKLHVDFIKGQYKEKLENILHEILKNDKYTINYLTVSSSVYYNNYNKNENISSNINTDNKINLSSPPKNTINFYKATKLNPKYTFSNFIQGNGNETAYASAIQVAKNPKKTPYNPLLVYGGVGLGKTHLVTAIGNHVYQEGIVSNILYLPSDQFVNEIVNSIKNNTIDKYKEFMKKKDMIIIDDIQFFARKEKSQEELFHIFNYIKNSGGQIILTSDFHPNDIHQLDDRLKSRFKQGLITDVRPPDLETRAAIIRLKAEELSLIIDNEIIMFIANNINTNVRDLEGAVIKLSFHQNLTPNKIIDIKKTKEILKELIKSKETTLNIDKIQDIVSEYFGIPKDLLLKKNRTKEIAEARAFAMYLCTTQLKATTQSIGMHFGGREHSTVSHAAKKIQMKLNKKDQETSSKLSELLNIINLLTY